MPTKQPPTKFDHNSPMKAAYRYYSELARLTAGLFMALIALMAFLLTVGLSHPGKTFQYFIYATTILLPLSLLAYVIGQGMVQMLGAKNYDLADKQNPAVKSTLKKLKIARLAQQILFILALITITGLALTTAHFFFAAQAQQQAQSAATAAPAQ